MRKLLLSVMFLFISANIFGAELGAGSGSDYPGALDTDFELETSTHDARADVPNDLAEAIVNIQNELGTDPAGASATVDNRFDAIDSNFDNFVTTNTDQNISGKKTFEYESTFSSNVITGTGLIHWRNPATWDIASNDTAVEISPMFSTYTITGVTSPDATFAYIQLKYRTNGASEGMWFFPYGETGVNIEFATQVASIYITHTFWIKLDSSQRFLASTQYDDEQLNMKCIAYIE